MTENTGTVDETVNSNSFNRSVIQEFRENSGKVGGFGDIPLLLLTTAGRRSGLTRTTPLVHLERDGLHIVFAANGGSPVPPGWYLNLVAAGQGVVEVGTERFPVKPVAVPEAEHEELWELQTAQDPNFATFRDKTDRAIPVVALVPVTDAG
ncbi:nitroreductase family deazaflavin-dependent oxidoreductase [Streptomyces sp. NBC_01335]|uniref:nitroreductase/quinone reductase family protein n=1 Tax=Streptomyces sp. NBC_01335 TaxID=2903828 RepID=UPI002E13A143|nr:nitroreductase family deazaflavin-dependent oxidoreductase [Streptomyces sp. NBC_01335]